MVAIADYKGGLGSQLPPPGGGGAGITERQLIANQVTTFQTVPNGGALGTFNNEISSVGIADISALDQTFTPRAPVDWAAFPITFFNWDTTERGLWVAGVRIAGTPNAPTVKGQFDLSISAGDTDGNNYVTTQSGYIDTGLANSEGGFNIDCETRPAWLNGHPFDIGIPQYCLFAVSLGWAGDDGATDFPLAGIKVTLTRLV